MLRVSEQNLCPICDHPDGCLYAKDGSATICSRVQEGSIKTVGEGPFSGGYLHIIKSDFKPKPVKKKRPVSINWGILNQCYRRSFNFSGNVKIVLDLIDTFQVACSTLNSIEPGWDSQAYTFPVRNSDDEIIGIQRRFPDGKKSMTKGSQVGIIIPRLNWSNLNILFICEGASDTATAINMGLRAISRLNYCTGKDHIIKFCIKKRPQKVVIVADNDVDGIRGAKTLGLNISQGYKVFTVTCPKIIIVIPPTDIKDLREWKEKGLTLDELMKIVEKNLDFEP